MNMSSSSFGNNPSLLNSILMSFSPVTQMIFDKNSYEISILKWYMYIKVEECLNEGLHKIMWVAYQAITEQSPMYKNLFLIVRIIW